MGQTQWYFKSKFEISLHLVQKRSQRNGLKVFWPQMAIFSVFLDFDAFKWVNPKNKATFTTEPQKVFIVKVVLFLPFDYITG